MKSLELNLEHVVNKSPFLIVVLGDFNSTMKGWYQNDMATFEGSKIDIETSEFSLRQIVKELTHIQLFATSCSDLIFTSQPNLVLHSSFHPLVHPNYHHQIVFAKFNR